MSKNKKILLGIATIWPFVYMVVFFGFIFSLFLNSVTTASEPPVGLFLVIFPLHFLTMLEIMVLFVVYIFNIFNNKRIEKDKKILWMLVLFVGNIFVMSVYWYLYIWKYTKKSKL